MPAVELLLRQDDLHTVAVIGRGDGVAQDAHRAHHAAALADLRGRGSRERGPFRMTNCRLGNACDRPAALRSAALRCPTAATVQFNIPHWAGHRHQESINPATPLLAHLLTEVGGVAHHKLRLCRLALAAHAHRHTRLIIHDLETQPGGTGGEVCKLAVVRMPGWASMWAACCVARPASQQLTALCTGQACKHSSPPHPA